MKSFRDDMTPWTGDQQVARPCTGNRKQEKMQICVHAMYGISHYPCVRTGEENSCMRTARGKLISLLTFTTDPYPNSESIIKKYGCSAGSLNRVRVLYPSLSGIPVLREEFLPFLFFLLITILSPLPVWLLCPGINSVTCTRLCLRN